MTVVHIRRGTKVSNEFREWLKAIRGARALSRKGLARNAMVDQGTVSRVESGISEPTDDYLGKIARPLGLDPAYLIARAAADRLGAQGVAYLVADHGRGVDPETSNDGPIQELQKLGEFKQPTEGIPWLSGHIGLGTLPLYAASAGEPFMWTTTPLASVTVSQGMARKADAGFIVSGNSLSARGFVSGMVVMVKRLAGDARPPSGKVVLIEVNGQFSAMVYRTGPGFEYVESDETGKAPMPLQLSDDVRLVGQVVGVELHID